MSSCSARVMNCPSARASRSRARNRVGRAILGGWQLNGIFTRQSGYPTAVRSGLVAATNQLFATFNVPDRVPGVSMYLPNGGPDGWFSAEAFTQPGRVNNVKGTPLQLFGNAARRVGRGPGTTNLDFSIFRIFSFGNASTYSSARRRLISPIRPPSSCPAPPALCSPSVTPISVSLMLRLQPGGRSSLG